MLASEPVNETIFSTFLGENFQFQGPHPIGRYSRIQQLYLGVENAWQTTYRLTQIQRLIIQDYRKLWLPEGIMTCNELDLTILFDLWQIHVWHAHSIRDHSIDPQHHHNEIALQQSHSLETAMVHEELVRRTQYDKVLGN